jgi:hypothetical protein
VDFAEIDASLTEQYILLTSGANVVETVAGSPDVETLLHMTASSMGDLSVQPGITINSADIATSRYSIKGGIFIFGLFSLKLD